MSDIIHLSFSDPRIEYLCTKDKRLAKVISMVGPISYTSHNAEPYSFLVHEIIEQMLSKKAATVIYTRLESLCNGSVSPAVINSLSDNELCSIGTSRAKVEYIRILTSALLTGSLSFDYLEQLSDLDVIRDLSRLRGIGRWI